MGKFDKNVPAGDEAQINCRGSAEEIRTRIGQLINFDAVARATNDLERNIAEFTLSKHARRGLIRCVISFERY